MKKFSKGQKVKYIGKGFISFDPLHAEMEVIEHEGKFDLWVEYKGHKMLVSNYEITSL